MTVAVGSTPFKFLTFPLKASHLHLLLSFLALYLGACCLILALVSLRVPFRVCLQSREFDMRLPVPRSYSSANITKLLVREDSNG